MDMTIEELEQYSGIVANIEAIREEIDVLYSPISSPNGHESVGQRGNTPSNPTERSAMRIISLKEQLESYFCDMLTKREEIEKWLETVTDGEIQAIIRWKYLIPKSGGKNRTWAEVSLKVYGRPDYWAARDRIRWFFNEKNKVSLPHQKA